MNVLVLGGCGIQGRAALLDLSKESAIDRIVCADVFPETIEGFSFLDRSKIETVRIDASDPVALESLMKQNIDVVIDMLPAEFGRTVALAAIAAGVPAVNTNYGYPILDLDGAAAARGVALMPECGLDPGIDLVIYRYGADWFDRLDVLNSYCGGVPEPKACTNPLKYKISWNWDMVLKTQKRDSVLIRDKKRIPVSADHQHANEFIHEIEFPGLGRLEAFPNGNAAHFVDLLHLEHTIVESGRYTLRWPGWCAFWSNMKQLGLLADEPVSEKWSGLTPHRFLVEWLEPRLQYAADEKDLAVMHNVMIGEREGKRQKLISNVLIERDLNSGIMGMALGVSTPACIAAQMLADGTISKKGVLSPVCDIPPQPFFDALRKRGIQIDFRVEPG
ncbi:MAG: saccharopine dehydrogenase C-terminal domain-containing protein [Thermodesulfobacteriota bacterium]